MKTVIKNGQVWNGEKFEIKDIFLSDEFIEDITSSCEGSFNNINIIDAQNKYILPGIIDCHVHLNLDGSIHSLEKIAKMTEFEAMFEAIISASKLIKSGITTVRDCGDINFEVLAVRNEINKGRLKGPRIIACGPALKMTGGHYFGKVIDGVEEARKAARELIAAGVDCFKFMASGGFSTMGIGEEPGTVQLDVDEMAIIIKEGEKRNITSCAHAHGKQSILNALNAGVTSVEHCTFIDEEVTEKILEKDAFVVPTFSAHVLIAEQGNQGIIPEHRVNMNKQVYKEKVPRFNKAYKSGIKVAFGRDSGPTCVEHENFVVEMKAMESAGMSRKDIIISATENAAKLLKLWNKVGSLEKGKYADIILLEGNPLDNLENFEKLYMVIKDGIKIYKKDEKINVQLIP